MNLGPRSWSERVLEWGMGKNIMAMGILVQQLFHAGQKWVGNGTETEDWEWDSDKNRI